MPEGTHPGADRRAWPAEMARRRAQRAGGDRFPDLRRARRRPTTSTAWCATTSCAGAQRGRHPGQPRRQGRARRPEPRHRQADARRGCSPSPTRYGARVKVAEVPPGPPVLQTLVAEIYGPDYERQIAHRPEGRRDIFEQDRRRGGRGLVRGRGPAASNASRVDQEKAALARHLRRATWRGPWPIALAGTECGPAPRCRRERGRRRSICGCPRPARSELDDLLRCRYVPAAKAARPARASWCTGRRAPRRRASTART